MFLLRKLHASQNGRYAIVVVVTTVAEVALFAYIVGKPGWSAWALIVASTIGFTLNFFGHVHYTFRGDVKSLRKQFSFLMLKVGILLLRIALYDVFIRRAGLGPWISYGLTVFIGILSYGTAKWLVLGVSPQEQLRELRQTGLSAAFLLFIYFRKLRP